MDNKKDKVEVDSLQDETPTSTPEPIKEEKITINRKDFDSLVSRVASIEKGSVTEEKEVEEIKNRTALIRFLEEKPVIGFGATYEKKDVDGRRYLMLQVITDDKKIHEVEYLPFMNQGKQELGEIVNIEQGFEVIKNGMLDETKYDYKNYKSYQTGEKVENVVKIPKNMYTLKLKDGREITLPEKALN